MIALVAVLLATVTGNPPPANYTCNGSTTIYTIPFPYLASSQLAITVTPAGGTARTLALTTDYTVKPAIAPSTGTLTLTTACANGSTLTVSRVVPLTQPQSFRTGAYNGPAHEQAFDRTEMQVQQNAAAHAADKVTQAAKDLAQDAATANVSNSVAALNGSSQAVTSASSVLAFGSTTPITLTSWFSYVANVKAFNAKCDGVTDDSTAVAAAVTSLSSSGGIIFFPPGVCKLNITITKSGVVLQGSGYGNVNTGVGGTKLIAANNAIPIIQIGDGTTTVRPARITGMTLVGDQVNATGDGISILGASDVAIDNTTVTSFGRHDITITSSATLPSSGIYLSAVTLAAARGTALNAVYGPQWVTNVSTTGSHINGWSTATSFAIALDGVLLWMTNTYVDIGGNAVGGVKMLKSGATNPGITATACAFDNPGGNTAVTLDVSTFAAKSTRINSWINGTYSFNGSVVFSDGTVNIGATGRGGFIYQPSILNQFVIGKLYMPFDETDFATNVGFSRSGTAGSGNETISAGTFSRLSGVFQSFHNALTYSASITPDSSTGNIFEIIPTDGVGFTVNGPTHVVQGQFLTFRIKNTFGTLGAVTWNATYKMAAWTQPANGFSRSITFYHDGTALYEVSRTPADVPN